MKYVLYIRHAEDAAETEKNARFILSEVGASLHSVHVEPKDMSRTPALPVLRRLLKTLEPGDWLLTDSEWVLWASVAEEIYNAVVHTADVRAVVGRMLRNGETAMAALTHSDRHAASHIKGRLVRAGVGVNASRKTQATEAAKELVALATDVALRFGPCSQAEVARRLTEKEPFRDVLPQTLGTRLSQALKRVPPEMKRRFQAAAKFLPPDR